MTDLNSTIHVAIPTADPFYVPSDIKSKRSGAPRPPSQQSAGRSTTFCPRTTRRRSGSSSTP